MMMFERLDIAVVLANAAATRAFKLDFIVMLVLTRLCELDLVRRVRAHPLFTTSTSSEKKE